MQLQVPLQLAHAATAQPERPAPPFVSCPRHDAGTYSVEAAKQLPFPRAGGATGSIRFKPEMSHGASESALLPTDAPAACDVQ